MDETEYEALGTPPKSSNATRILQGVIVGLMLIIVILVGVVIWQYARSDDSNSTECPTVDDEDTSLPSYVAPENAFKFSDIFNLKVVTPGINWVTTGEGQGWVAAEKAENGKKFLKIYGYSQEDLENPDPSGDIEPTETVYYPEDEFPQDAALWLISPSGDFVLFGFDYTQLYRHSYYATWRVCSSSTYECQDLTPGNDKNDVRLVEWANDNKISYVRQDNLYVVLDPTNVEGSTLQVTKDGGGEDGTINGAPDWVYEEEVFSSASASYWSPGSTYLAYLKFQQGSVPLYNITMYNYPDIYPGQFQYRYPCPGEKNSFVSLWIFDTATSENYQVPDQEEEYFAQVIWANDELLSFRKMDLLQQTQVLYKFPVGEDSEVTQIYTETDELAYTVPSSSLTYILDGAYYLDILPRNNYFRLVMISTDGQAEELVLTESLDADVTTIYGYDSALDRVYFSASGPTSPLESNLFFTAAQNPDGVPVQMREGDENWLSASFSPELNYFVLYSLGLDIPSTSMVSTAAYSKTLTVLEDNREFRSKIEGLALPQRKYQSFLSADGQEISGMFYYPPGFDENADTKYPVLMFSYGGPDSQVVNYNYQLSNWNYHSYLSSSLGVIVVYSDGRGTHGRGQDFLKSTYLQLGVLETEDQLAVAKQLADLPYVHPDRIGLWGWSFGGYLSSRVLSAGDPVMRFAMAVAPVSDWRFYDNIYTERYMQSPQLNDEGYDRTSVLDRASQILPNSSYMLVHGTGDDNVHFQNAADFVTALVEADVSFQTMYYPDKTHSISGTSTRIHLWKVLTDFLVEPLGITPVYDVDAIPRKLKQSSSSREEQEESPFYSNVRNLIRH